MDIKIIENFLEKINMELEAKILSINPERTFCEIKILEKINFRGGEEEGPIISEVPIPPIFSSAIFELYGAYKKGDKVLIKFFSKTQGMNNEGATKGIDRKDRFNINDCYVSRPIKPRNDTNNASSTGFIIKNKINGNKFELKENGGFEVIGHMKHTGDFDIIGELTVSESITASKNITAVKKITGKLVEGLDDVIGGGISLKDHTHKYKPGSSPPIETVKPTGGGA